MKETFVSKIRNHPPAVGTLITQESPEIAELLSLCGFDWLFIDMEHGGLTPPSAQRIVQAIGDRCSTLIRIPESSPMWIAKALDAGCDGIIIPQVRSADEARAIVQAAKYPPEGARSVGIGRAHDYGLAFTEYVQTANARTAVVIQIEHIDAVNRVDEILAVPGIDAVQIGPYDLSGSMKRLGEVTSEPVQAALATIKRACHAASIPVGMFVVQPDAAVREVADGCQFVAIGTDCTLLASAAKGALNLVKNSH